MARPRNEEQSVQKSVYFKASTWKVLERAFGYGKISANLEKIVLRWFENPNNEKKEALSKINRTLAEFNGLYEMRLEIREKEEAPKPLEEKTEQL